ncbi:MAG: hypothetical protein Q8S32_17190 [Burkholderiaceae bacterium]|nr:hypothetical protein [Burkholderiaceae bacterium]
MEKRITVHNPTAMALYVGSDMVPPYETRDFPESRVPPHLRPQDEPAPVAEAEPDLIAELLALSVKDIVSSFDTLSDEDLVRLAELENAGEITARKSLLSAIAEAQLERAAKKEDGDAGDTATGATAGASGANG